MPTPSDAGEIPTVAEVADLLKVSHTLFAGLRSHRESRSTTP